MPSWLSATPTSSLIEDERHHACLLARRSDQAQAGHREQFRRTVIQQLMLVGGDIFHPDSAHVIDRSSESNGIGNVAGTSLEACGRRLVGGFFERTVGNHVSATLPWRHGVEHVELAENYADSCGPKNFVPGEYVEVAIESLHIHGHVGK